MDYELLKQFIGEHNAKLWGKNIWPDQLYIGPPNLEFTQSLSRGLGKFPLLNAIGRSRFDQISRRRTLPKLTIRAVRSAADGKKLVRSAHSFPRYMWCSFRHTFLFDNAAEFFPCIGEIERDWPARFGLEKGMIITRLSYTRSSLGFPLHWDEWATIQFQLRGCKEWYIEDKSAAKSTDPKPESVTASPPTKFIKHTLKPGDIMFMPSEYWHQTKTHTGSLSFILCLAPPSWFHFLPRDLHDKAKSKPGWNERVLGVWNVDSGRAHAIEQLSKLIETSPYLLDGSTSPAPLDTPAVLYDSIASKYFGDNFLRR